MRHMHQIRGLVRIQFPLIANVSANFILIAFILAMAAEKPVGPTLIHGHEISDCLSLCSAHSGHYSWLI